MDKLDKFAAFQKDEVARAAETLARSLDRLAREAAEKAAGMRAVAADVDGAFVPMFGRSAMSTQVDQDLADFRAAEAALKVLLRAERYAAAE